MMGFCLLNEECLPNIVKINVVYYDCLYLDCLSISPSYANETDEGKKFTCFLVFFFFKVGPKPKASWMLGKHPTAKLGVSSHWFLFLILCQGLTKLSMLATVASFCLLSARIAGHSTQQLFIFFQNRSVIRAFSKCDHNNTRSDF